MKIKGGIFMWEPYEEYRPRSVEGMTASAGARIGASLIDMIISLIAAIPLIIWLMNRYNYVMKVSDLANINAIGASMLGITLLYSFISNLIFQFIIPMKTKGQTLGKRAVGIRMVSEYGDYLSNDKLFLRSIVYTIIPFIEEIPGIGGLIAFIMLLFWLVSLVLIFIEPNQALHDKMAECLVVEDNRYQALMKREQIHHNSNSSSI
jgi:uncharacterized RDD family membrane protein YckC